MFEFFTASQNLIFAIMLTIVGIFFIIETVMIYKKAFFNLLDI